MSPLKTMTCCAADWGIGRVRPCCTVPRGECGVAMLSVGVQVQCLLVDLHFCWCARTLGVGVMQDCRRGSVDPYPRRREFWSNEDVGGVWVGR